MLIDKREFYRLGGFSNSNLFRKMIGGRWKHFKKAKSAEEETICLKCGSERITTRDVHPAMKTIFKLVDDEKLEEAKLLIEDVRKHLGGSDHNIAYAEGLILFLESGV